MLTITVPGIELFDNEKQEFIDSESIELKLEHSLVSLSKWESIYEKPYLGSEQKTTEEALNYVFAMIVSPEVTIDILNQFSTENIEAISNYIEAKRTATWFNEVRSSPKSNETITSELIYYWMTMFNIPIECENWHLNRLFTLIRICNLKNSKPKKMSRSEIAARNREINASRRAKLGTTG